MKKTIGMYAWGGPGTVQLLKTKYHSPQIDEKSFLELYEAEYWQKAQELFEVSDAWLTYSWGFSNERELESYQFVRSKLAYFHKLGINTHGYVQGFNVVTEDFINEDIFCTDPQGNLLPYSKGRSFTCPNNPTAVKIILDRVEKACEEGFAGVFIDNIIFGLPPVYVSADFVPFFGCACKLCHQQYKNMFGDDLPLHGFNERTIKSYLQFRVRSVEKVIAAAFEITQKYKKKLGVNLYDPFLHTAELYFGYSLVSLDKYLSYYLLENHSHPGRIREGNVHLEKFIKSAKKPVFVVSYKNGIGFESEFSQNDIDLVFSESEVLHYSPCLKVTEFTTNGVWHALRLDSLRKPSIKKVNITQENRQNIYLIKSSFLGRFLGSLKQKYLALVLNVVYENKWLDLVARKLGLFQKQLWSVKREEFNSV